MKRCILFLLVICSYTALAQSDLHCATDEAMKKYYNSHPNAESDRMIREHLKSGKSFARVGNYTIPIVFHIMHLNGPENISDEQVVDAVRILNRDYAKQNPDVSEVIPSFQPIADSSGIHFMLAKTDPFGACTNGIIHHYSTDADWDETTSSTLYSYTWDPTMYLNVYVVKTITLSGGFAAAGYTYFPGTFAPGDPYDAIVVLNNYFGSTGTGDPFLSRVLTHEVGHWLNLLHVFGYNSAGADCTGDDFVNDTPPTPGYLNCPDINDPAAYQICNPGTDENFQNYMDYSYCCRMFTHDQAGRMEDALNDNISARDNLWTLSNLNATGVYDTTNICAPVADFKYSRDVTCTGSPVIFYDASWNGSPANYNWSFPGANPASSTSPNPSVIYSSAGIYSVTLTTSNASGISTPETKSNIITVINNSVAIQNNWFEDFEAANIPGNNWSIENSSGGTNWIVSFDAAYSGIFSAELPTAGNGRKVRTSLIGPSIDLSTINFPILSFRLAVAEVTPNHINNLAVYISTDCEETWTQIYSKTGQTLVTTNDSANPFIPLSPADWRSEVIPLFGYSAAPSAKFKFTYTRDTIPTPSNVFIDDINITSSTSINSVNYNPDFKIYPNPLSENKLQIYFAASEYNRELKIYNANGNLVYTSLLPENSTGQIIDVSYLQNGVYQCVINSEKDYVVKKLIVLKN